MKLLTSLQNDKHYREAASVSYQAPFHEDGPLVCITFDSLTPREETGYHQTGSLVGPRAGQDAVKTANCVPSVNRTPKSSHCSDQPTRPTQDGKVQSLPHCLLEHHANTYGYVEDGGATKAPYAARSTSGERPTVIHWTADLVGPRVGLDAVEKRNIPVQTGNRTQIICGNKMPTRRNR